MKATFENTVDILVKAYLNDTLKHGNCAACAVGNIVAKSLEYKVQGHSWLKNNKSIIPEWDLVFCTAFFKQDVDETFYFGTAKKQIDSTGYTWRELSRIEKAFESIRCKSEDWNSDEHMLKGLFAVVDELAIIHGINLEQKEEAKLMFTKTPVHGNGNY